MEQMEHMEAPLEWTESVIWKPGSPEAGRNYVFWKPHIPTKSAPKSRILPQPNPAQSGRLWTQAFMRIIRVLLPCDRAHQCQVLIVTRHTTLMAEFSGPTIGSLFLYKEHRLEPWTGFCLEVGKRYFILFYFYYFHFGLFIDALFVFTILTPSLLSANISLMLNTNIPLLRLVF